MAGLRSAVVTARGLLRLVSSLTRGVDSPVARARSVIGALRGHGLTLAGLGSVAAAREPDGVAVIDDDGPVRHRELDAVVGAVAEVVAVELGGATAGRRVGLCCRNGRGFVAGALGVSRAGADLVPLDPDLPVPGLRRVLAAERIELVLQEDSSAEPSVGSSANPDSAWVVAACAEAKVPAVVVPTAGASRPGALRRSRHRGHLVMLTTGTTGPAKGVDRGRVRAIQGLPVATLVARLPVRRDEPMMVLPPLFHGFGLGLLALGMAVGAPVVLSRRFESGRVWDLVAAERVRTLVVVPPMLAELVDDPRAGDRAQLLSAVVSGAGTLHPDLAQRSRRVLGDVLHNLYGSTEHGWATLADPAALAEAPGTVGRPPTGVRVEVRAADGERAAPGEEGRVWVGGVLDLTSRRGLSDTGDLGYLDREGRLFVTGRVDDVVVTGGENVWTGEVESALRAHPDVVDAAVTGAVDERYGTRLVARVVLASGSTTGPEELQAHLRQVLPPAARPRELLVVDSLDLPGEPGR